MYYPGMDTEKSKQLWHRLQNEPETAFRAFECFLTLPRDATRTVVAAYRRHTGNAVALKPSDTWTRWSRDFAWRERAAAYDDHLENMRREAYERVIEEEAERQAREIKKIRGRFNELMTVAYHRAMECLEDESWVRDNLRASDVIRIIGGHLDYLKIFDTEPESREDDWEEDDAAGEQIVKEVDALPYLEHPDSGEEDNEGSEEGSGEDHAEEGEGGQD
jgi:hypothetical protein